jgi:hypothetical protein
VFQQSVASSKLGFGTSYDSDLFSHWYSLSIWSLEACSLLLEHFVAASIVFIGAIC